MIHRPHSDDWVGSSHNCISQKCISTQLPLRKTFSEFQGETLASKRVNESEFI